MFSCCLKVRKLIGEDGREVLPDSTGVKLPKIDHSCPHI